MKLLTLPMIGFLFASSVTNAFVQTCDVESMRDIITSQFDTAFSEVIKEGLAEAKIPVKTVENKIAITKLGNSVRHNVHSVLTSDITTEKGSRLGISYRGINGYYFLRELTFHSLVTTQYTYDREGNIVETGCKVHTIHYPKNHSEEILNIINLDTKKVVLRLQNIKGVYWADKMIKKMSFVEKMD